MKKILFTILTAATGFLFAEPSDLLPPPIDSKLPTQQDLSSPKEGFFYVRFAAAENNLADIHSVLPGLGIGYRRLAGDGAADISFSGIDRSEYRSGRFFWTAPKTSYVHYLRPNETKSAYFGGGLAWGGMSLKEQRFIGIIPSATAGYEFARKQSFLGFAEFTISQPALSVYKRGAFPGPCAEFSTGIGF